MAHKVSPKSYRIKRTGDWLSRGFYKKPSESLEEDYLIRSFINKKLSRVGVENIEIERFPSKINIIITSSRPGLIIGRGGEGIEKLKKELEKEIIKKSPRIKNEKERKKQIKIEIREIKNPWTSASLTAQWAANQIERRVPYRRVLKQTISKAITNKEVKGVKIEVSGRLNGAEIARREWLKKGRLPLQTIRSDIDYSLAEAHCNYGTIGVKVWLYKGDKFDK